MPRGLIRYSVRMRLTRIGPLVTPPSPSPASTGRPAPPPADPPLPVDAPPVPGASPALPPPPPGRPPAGAGGFAGFPACASTGWEATIRAAPRRDQPGCDNEGGDGSRK